MTDGYSYKLVVSRGYLRLMHHSDRPRPYGDVRWPSVDDEPLDPAAEPEAVDWDELEPPDWAYEDCEPDVPWWAYTNLEGPLGELAEEARRLDEAQQWEPGRGDGGQSGRSRNNMRRMFAALPWEMLGARPAMVSLTYPGEWQRWVADGRVLERHRKAFERRWVRKWKEPLIGVWAKEFQESGRPHMHLYIGLPEEMAAADFAGLRERTLLRHRLEQTHGRFEGRRRLPAIGQEYGGEFAMWVRRAWSEVVGTQGVDQRHHARGVDVAVMFWTDEVAARADRTRVAEYLAREASKWRQKKPPAGFYGMGRYYGRFGQKFGFNPVTEETGLDPLVWLELERRLNRWVNWKLHVLRRGAPPSTGFLRRRRVDGLTAFGLGPEQAKRLLAWSNASAGRKRSRNPAQRGSGGLAPGEITKSA